MAQKNRLEEYIKALIKAEESRMTVNIILLIGSLVLFMTVCMVIIVTSKSPILAGAIIIALVTAVGYFLVKRLRREQAEAEKKRDLLHPTEGDEGLIVSIKKQINDTIVGLFGKKFTGLRTKDDLDGRDNA